jgi:hypothetical protein
MRRRDVCRDCRLELIVVDRHAPGLVYPFRPWRRLRVPLRLPPRLKKFDDRVLDNQ